MTSEEQLNLNELWARIYRLEKELELTKTKDDPVYFYKVRGYLADRTTTGRFLFFVTGKNEQDALLNADTKASKMTASGYATSVIHIASTTLMTPDEVIHEMNFIA